ncbi:hypothetical protein H6775_00335 [Candidatus Nomurabacteria bacterium]|nr:hypothetical protein [Candidatus Nomurabacteria bacterium]
MFAFPLKEEDFITDGIVKFFDLLSSFDYEDKLKERSGYDSVSLDPSPRDSELDSDPGC